MSQTSQELQILISVARVDAALNDLRTELGHLPAAVREAERKLGNLESNEQAAASKLEELVKERRETETGVEDNGAKIAKYRNQLMEVKTNKEYQAMLHEIEHLEKDTDAKEERLLILMDELDQEEEQHRSLTGESGQEKSKLSQDKSAAEARMSAIEKEVAELEAQKPAMLKDLPAPMRSRYDRVLAKLKDFAVTHTVDDVCQGCFTRIPPQVAVEVRQNERLVTCEGCGRLLVHYQSDA
jgi:predicted  nucleic acid-binding Zn-ribbon protein